HTSSLTGQRWVDELMEGPWAHFHNNSGLSSMGMSKFVFLKLVHALRVHCRFAPTKHVSCEEQLAIFL
ncbi:hypothetical protein B0H19DRAFT_854764, partial [Mycena capillaripes]